METAMRVAAPTHSVEPKLSFNGCLTRLERAVTLTIVPGELDSWCFGVDGALRTLSAKCGDWREMQRALHHEVSRRDPALNHRVERLEDHITRRFDELHILSRAVDRIGQDPDVTGYGLASELRECVVEWVIEVRALEREATTWWVESLYRDRGVAD